MNKKLIRLTEADLHRIVRGSVKNVLYEMNSTKHNVDIHFDFAMSVTVEANSPEEAEEIVDDKIMKGIIKPTDAEPNGDYDLDTSYQPYMQ